METPNTEIGFSYEYGLDILVPDSGGTGPGTFMPFRFPTGINPTVDAVTVDASTYDDLGAPNQAKTSESWSATFNVQQHRLADGSYLPEVEALMALTAPGANGRKAVGTFRWYDKPQEGSPNPNDAFEGDATVVLNRAETGNSGVGSWAVTLTGVGRRRRIENPFTGWGEGE